VVAGNSLEAAHTNKINKYQRIPGLGDGVGNLVGLENASIDHMPLTIPWRGIWSQTSAVKLLAIGVGASTLERISRYTMFGSFLNFRRFNSTTMRNRRDD
jgi:hypothetical protein